MERQRSAYRSGWPPDWRWLGGDRRDCDEVVRDRSRGPRPSMARGRLVRRRAARSSGRVAMGLVPLPRRRDLGYRGARLERQRNRVPAPHPLHRGRPTCSPTRGLGVARNSCRVAGNAALLLDLRNPSLDKSVDGGRIRVARPARAASCGHGICGLLPTATPATNPRKRECPSGGQAGAPTGP